MSNNSVRQVNGKKSKQVFRPIAALAPHTTDGNSEFTKHKVFIESGAVNSEEDIVWYGRKTDNQGLPVSRNKLSASKHVENMATPSSLEHVELHLMPSSNQSLVATDCQYTTLNKLLKNGYTEAATSDNPFCNVSKEDEPNSPYIDTSEGGYEYTKNSKHDKSHNKMKAQCIAPIFQSNNALKNSAGGGPAKARRGGGGQSNAFLLWISQQGIDEGEITVSQPFSNPGTVKVGQTEVNDILVSNKGKKLVNLESVRLLYKKPKDSFDLRGHSNTEQTLTEVSLQYSKNSCKLPCLGPYSLTPGSSLSFQLSCTAKVVGCHRAVLLFDFGRHKVLRCANLVAEDEVSDVLSASEPFLRTKVKSFQIRGRPISGPPPPLPRFANPLGRYPIPDKVARSLLKKKTLPIFNKQLSFESYREYFMALMYAEELQWKADIRAYDLQNVTMDRDEKNFLILRVPGLLERRPSVIYRDSILVKPVDSGNKYKGYVYRVHADAVLLKFHSSLHKKYSPNQQYDVRFSYSRLTLRRCLHAIDDSKNLYSNFLFPTFIPPAVNIHGDFMPINRLLNKEQKQSVMEILRKNGGPPYLVYGPPGTGKTVTVVEGILQALKLKSNSKVLACAPSNAAADVLIDRLRAHIQVMDILRVNAYCRPLDDIAPELKCYCHIKGSFFCCPSIKRLMEYKVLVTTYYSAALLEGQGLEPGHFSHIFLDECGQGSEPEALVALSSFVTENTVVVLAGDHQQLGPIIRSPIAKKFGLGVSLLERLSTQPLYSRSSGDNVDKYDKMAVTKLVRNYRSHPAILDLPSRMFYNAELIACLSHDICNTFCDWEELPNKKFPVLFIGIEGRDAREGRSPSWFNAQEASKVVELVLKLKKHRRSQLKDNDIGIISPYNQQVKKIRIALEMKGITGIKIGSVEQFQGQERKVIIISTVRSSQEFIRSDQQCQIGFLDNPKRFNVAITRAKALLIIVGNPYVLDQDPHWGKLLAYCMANNSCVGCIPRVEDTTEIKELTEYLDLLCIATRKGTGNDNETDTLGTASKYPWVDSTSEKAPHIH